MTTTNKMDRTWHSLSTIFQVPSLGTRTSSHLPTFLAFGTLFFQLEKNSMSVTQLTPKGQILVPKHLRRKLGLKPGGKVHLDEEDGRLVLTPVPADPIEAATGFLKGRFSLTQDLRREHREEARRERKTRSR
jgi:AbrB family looped-hinge helix DNA binding protein